MASMLGGVLLAVVAVLGACSVVSDWVSLTLHIPPVVFLTAGMVGLRTQQDERLGQVGSVMATSAAAYLIGSLVFALHTLDTGVPKTMMPTIFILFGVSMLMLIVGSMLLGIASLHAGVLPRSAIMLLIIGSVAAVVPFIGGPLFGAGWTAIGYALWSDKGDSVS